MSASGMWGHHMKSDDPKYSPSVLKLKLQMLVVAVSILVHMLYKRANWQP